MTEQVPWWKPVLAVTGVIVLWALALPFLLGLVGLAITFWPVTLGIGIAAFIAYAGRDRHD